MQVVRNVTFPRCSKYLFWVFILLDIVYSLSTNTISCTHTSMFCTFVKPYYGCPNKSTRFKVHTTVVLLGWQH